MGLHFSDKVGEEETAAAAGGAEVAGAGEGAGSLGVLNCSSQLQKTEGSEEQRLTW